MLWNSDSCVAASSADAISRCENQEEKIASLADQLTIPDKHIVSPCNARKLACE